MLTTLEKWVETTPWAMVVAVNQSMCEGKENAPHRPGKGLEAARQLWESAVPRPMKLREALDLCRECHALAPFDFFNGNTMAAISRKMVESFLQRLPSLQAQMLRNAVGNYVAGVSKYRELEELCAYLNGALTSGKPV